MGSLSPRRSHNNKETYLHNLLFPPVSIHPVNLFYMSEQNQQRRWGRKGVAFFIKGHTIWIPYGDPKKGGTGVHTWLLRVESVMHGPPQRVSFLSMLCPFEPR